MSIFGAEVIGTALLILLGNGVVACVLLAQSKGQNAGWVVITFGWGLAVMTGAFAVGQFSGAHLNPAVTIGFWVAGTTDGGDVPEYLAGEFVGAFIGATLVWLAYLDHWKETEDPGLKLACFSTAPAIRNPVSNVITEVIGTFVLVFGILAFFDNVATAETGLGPLIVGVARGRDRHVARRSDGLRDQPGPRPRAAHHARDPADRGQGRLGLGLRVGPRRGAARSAASSRRSPTRRSSSRRRDSNATWTGGAAAAPPDL